MLPNSLFLEDWINPQHLVNENENWLITSPFEHCVINNFFKEDVFQSLHKSCKEVPSEMFKTHPDWQYQYAIVSDESFLNFIFSTQFKNFLHSKLSFNLKRCKAFPNPQVYLFDTTKEDGLEVHNDFEVEAPRDFGLIMYLHDEWEASFGGELQLFNNENLNEPQLIIDPNPNTIVGFRVSPISYHGVSPSRRYWKRMTIVVDWDL